MHNDVILLRFAACRAVTGQARLLEMPDGREVWFPVSQCPGLEDVDRDDENGEFECPEWLAAKKDCDA